MALCTATPIRLTTDERTAVSRPTRLDRRNNDSFGVRGEIFEIVDVDRRDDRATSEIGYGDEERIDRMLGAAPGRSEEPAGS